MGWKWGAGRGYLEAMMLLFGKWGPGGCLQRCSERQPDWGGFGEMAFACPVEDEVVFI